MNLNEFTHWLLIILLLCPTEMYHFSKTTEYYDQYNSTNWSIFQHLIQNYAADNLTVDSFKHLFNIQYIHEKDNSYAFTQYNNITNNEHQALALHVNYGRPEFGTHRILWIKLILAIIYGILAFMGITSNLIVAYILLFMRRRALTSITNIFVLVLAISDILLCSFNMPLQAYYELKETIILKNEVLCKFIFACFGLPMHISCLTILLIACDRYQIIIYPLRPRMSVKLALILIGFTVIISIINAIPIALFNMVSNAIRTTGLDIAFERQLYMHQFIPRSTHSYCVENWPNPESRLFYSVIVFLIHFFIPLTLTAGLYGHIYYRLHERRFRKGSVERKRRTNKILIRIVICFAVCWTPWTCFSLWLEIHAYEIQKNALNLNHRLDSNLYYTTLEDKMMHLNKYYSTLNTDNQSHTTANNSNANNISRNSSNDATTDEASIHQMSRNYRINYTLHPIGGNIKLLDLSLKLLAMTSACINPWLYGWFKKFVFTMTKKTGQKLKQFKPSKYDLLNIVQSLRDKYRICFTKKLTMQHIRKQVNRYENNNVVSVDGGDECDADRMQNKEKLNEGDYETDSTGPKLSVYICYCCGSICTCQLSFKWLNRKDHFRHMTRYHDNESYLTEPLAKSLNEYSERRVLSEAVIADLVKHTRNSSRASNSNSSRHYGSKNSNGPMGTGNIIAGTNQQHEKATDTISSTGKYGKLIKESIQTKTTSYTKSRRRTSSRLSGISFGTMSYLDPSTKQTSLFPSSGMLPTPRSSFLNTASQVSRNENNQEGDDVEQQQQQHNELQVPSISHEVHMNAVNNSYYQLPSTSRYFTPNLLKPLPDVDSMKYEHESSLEGEHVLSITIPIPQTTMTKIHPSEIDKVKEKLNNSMSIIPLSDIPCHSNHSDNERLDILPEIIKVDVHTQTTEVKYDYSNIRLLKTNRRRNDDYKNNSCTSKHDLTEEDYKGQNTLQIKLSESYAASIPFVDEESSITEEYHPIGFIQTLKDNPLSITYSYITRNETLKEVSDEQTSMDVPVTSSASQQQQEQQNAQMSSQSTLTAATKETQDRNSSVREKKSRQLSMYMKNSSRRISTSIHLFSQKRRPSERRGTIDKPIRHRLSFHGKTNVKKPVNSDEKKTQLQKQSSDLFASTSDELSDLDDFAHISRMVAREVMRKQRARERAKSICVTPTVNSRNDKELEDKTTPINTIEKENKSHFNKRKSFTVFPRFTGTSDASTRHRFTHNSLNLTMNRPPTELTEA